MNLLCPNCQKMLTVPDQYAGQLMKCTLCGGTFTVPALPASAPAASVPPTLAPAPTPTPAPAPAPADVYGLRSDGNPPATPAWSPSLAPSPPPPSPAVPDHAEPPLVTAAPTVSPAPDMGTVPPPSTSMAEGYHRTCTVWFSPKVLPWVAPVCLVLVFFLQFFSWVGVYPGGVPMITASAWGAAFAGGTVDPDLDKVVLIGKALSPDRPGEPLKPNENPFAAASVLAIFYLLLFLLLGLPLTIASVVIDRVPLKLPPVVQKFLPWRWGIVLAVNLVLFLFLGLQLLLGFGMESQYRDWVEKNVSKPASSKTQDIKVSEAERGMALDALRWTVWLKLAALLHLVVLVCAALMFWVDRRGTSRPLPRLELLW